MVMTYEIAHTGNFLIYNDFDLSNGKLSISYRICIKTSIFRQWEVVDIYRNIISGYRSSHLNLDMMLKDVWKNWLDTVLFVKGDRISKSQRDLFKKTGECGSYNIRLSFTD